MHPPLFTAAALALILLGIYAFPIPKASQRVIYSRVPPPVVQALERFRRQHRPKRLRTGSGLWRYHDTEAGEDALLFLHGMGGSGDIWFQQIEALKARFRCIAVTYPPLPSLDMLRLGIQDILAHERISRVGLLGSSMGGYLAQSMAARSPEAISRLVLGNTFAPSDIISRRAAAGARWLPWVPEWAIMAGFRRNAEKQLFPSSESCELVKAYLYEQTCGSMRKPDLIARCACLCQTLLPPDLDRLGIPALIVESDNDPLVEEPLREALKAAYPTAAVRTFDRGGHFPYLSRPEEFNRTLVEFLSGQPGESAEVAPSAASPRSRPAL
jgi:pimeloyl-ACP methyl ester carboxylesterase